MKPHIKVLTTVILLTPAEKAEALDKWLKLPNEPERETDSRALAKDRAFYGSSGIYYLDEG